MRNALSEGVRIARPATRKRVAEAEEAEGYEVVASEQMKQWTNEIDRIIRFNIFLTHSNLNAHEVIDTITGGALGHDTNQFITLRTKVLENTRTHKNKTIDGMEDHIAKLLEDNTWLRGMPEHDFKNYLSNHLNAQNWAAVFNYIKDYIDLDNSSDLAKWFIKNIYANLGAECRTLVQAGGRKTAETERKAVLTAWDAMALREEFDNMDISEIAELSNRVRADRERRKRDFTEVKNRFSIVGGSAPPKRSRPRVAMSGRGGGAAGGSGDAGDDSFGGGFAGGTGDFGGDANTELEGDEFVRFQTLVNPFMSTEGS